MPEEYIVSMFRVSVKLIYEKKEVLPSWMG
jgi:hypothetical protein